MSELRLYVVDTHALVWHVTGSERLSDAARAAFAEAEAGNAVLIIPMIVLAETAWIVQRGRVAGFSMDELLQALRQHPGYEIAPLTEGTFELFLQASAIPEMHDRLIVAEAQRYSASLITVDQAIHDAGLVDVVW